MCGRLHSAIKALRFQHEREDAVIWPHEQMAFLRQDSRALSLASDSRVDHGDGHGPRRIERHRLLEHLGRVLDVVRRHLMRQVDDAQPRLDAPHHALAHRDGAVLDTEVRQEKHW